MLKLKFGNGWLTSNCCNSSKKFNSGFQFQFQFQGFQFQFHFQFHQFQFQFQFQFRNWNWNWAAIPIPELNWPQPCPCVPTNIMCCANVSGIILCMCSANERRRYNVTLSFIGWAHSQNDSWMSVNVMSCEVSGIYWHSEAWIKWKIYLQIIFRMHFLEIKFCILIKISLKFIPKGPIDNKSALVLSNGLVPSR